MFFFSAGLHLMVFQKSMKPVYCKYRIRYVLQCIIIGRYLTWTFCSTQSIQIWLKSVRGPIDVYLCPEEQGNHPSPIKDISPIKQPPAPQSTPSRFLLTPEKTPQNCISAALPYKAPCHKYNGDVTSSVGPSLISPQKNIFLQSDSVTFPEDLDDDSLIPLSPNLTDEEYLFTLTDTEGITDLFNSYGLWDDAWKVSGTMYLLMVLKYSEKQFSVFMVIGGWILVQLYVVYCLKHVYVQEKGQFCSQGKYVKKLCKSLYSHASTCIVLLTMPNNIFYLDFACQNDTLIQVNDHKKTVTVVMCSRYKIYAKP